MWTNRKSVLETLAIFKKNRKKTIRLVDYHYILIAFWLFLMVIAISSYKIKIMTVKNFKGSTIY